VRCVATPREEQDADELEDKQGGVGHCGYEAHCVGGPLSWAPILSGAAVDWSTASSHLGKNCAKYV